MKPTLIILAAGQGTRLRPLTDSVPKCMVQVHGRGILEWQIDVARKVGLENIIVVGGYRADQLVAEGAKILVNEQYESTNMVQTLFCASEYMNSDVVVSYGDILYEEEVLRRVMESEAEVAVAADLAWHAYWSARFEDVLDDAETFRMGAGQIIKELGGKPECVAEIEAQYIGLVSLRGEGLAEAKGLYLSEIEAQRLGKPGVCRERDIDALYMTDFLQGLIDRGTPAKGVCIHGRWLEIDDVADHRLAEELSSVVNGQLVIER